MSHYDTLGVVPGATYEELRTAYKRLAMKHHPDRGGDAKRFAEITKAYEALSIRVCPVCGGKGKIRERNGAFIKTVNCPRCWQQ